MSIDFSDFVKLLGVVAAIVIFAGGIIAGLSRWIGETLARRWFASVQADYDSKLARLKHRLDELGKLRQASLDHAVTVSRVQFEEEFRAVREVWKYVARTRAAAVALVEVTVPENDTPSGPLQRLVPRHQAFEAAHRKLVLAIDNNSPFYPQTIFAVVDSFRSTTALELLRLKTRKPFDGDWFDQREASREEILAKAEIVSATIRARLNSIVIRDAADSSSGDDR